MADLSGQTIGRYRILEQLGEGGMATVYKTYDQHLDREVALKVIRVDQLTQSSLKHMLQRFEREARVLARLSHPNIVKVYDSGLYKGIPLFVMEYLPGGTLKSRTGKPVAWLDAVRLVLPVARALAYAHQRGVIHRDVKPSNILFNDLGEPMLSDFGIARIMEGEVGQTLTSPGSGIGTPGYMAPEQWTGQADERSDVYSLGVVLFELVTGQKPYTADTPAAMLLKQAHDPLPKPGRLVKRVPRAVEQLLLKSLARNKDKRFPSMEAMVAELEDLAGVGKLAPDKGKKKSGSSTRPVEVPRAPAATTLSESRPPGTKPPAQPAITHTVEARPPVPRGGAGPSAKPFTREKQAPSTRKILALAVAVPLFLLAAGGAALGLYKTFSGKSTPLPAAMSTQTSSPTQELLAASSTVSDAQPPVPTAAHTLGIGSTWIRPADGMTMVYVPEGEFTMGMDADDAFDHCQNFISDCSRDWFTNAEPVHIVHLNAYWIDKTEITNAMYGLCVSAGDCQPPVSAASNSRVDYFSNLNFTEYPVIHVDWFSAQAYCVWAGGRLPSEAEWESAARGLQADHYPWGNELPTCDLANINTMGNLGCTGDTNEVGAYPGGVSPYGALGMAGNVFEWVGDWFDENYYAESPHENPGGPVEGSSRVMRGGSWNYFLGNTGRSSDRNSSPPEMHTNYIGFRCARSADPSNTAMPTSSSTPSSTFTSTVTTTVTHTPSATSRPPSTWTPRPQSTRTPAQPATITPAPPSDTPIPPPTDTVVTRPPTWTPP